MITYGGERVTLTTGVPSIYTIGVSIGRVPRFCGHTKHWYPVLCHCSAVARLLPEELGLHGLMHDFQENVFADVPTPMKTQVARNREERVLRRIYEANGIEWPDEETMDLVHEADYKALVAEAYILGHPGAATQWPEEPDAEAARLTKWHLQRNSTRFLDRRVSGPYLVSQFNHFMKLASVR